MYTEIITITAIDNGKTQEELSEIYKTVVASQLSTQFRKQILVQQCGHTWDLIQIDNDTYNIIVDKKVVGTVSASNVQGKINPAVMSRNYTFRFFDNE